MVFMIVLKMALLLLSTFFARVLSPSIVLLTTLSLFFSHSQTLRSSSPITPVVVANAVPRRALILTLLSLVALTYLLDGLFFVVYAVVDNDWPRHSGIPINTVTGLMAFSGLAALGAWKEIHGVEVWLLRRVKVAIAADLALDISLAVMLALHIRQGPTCELPSNSILTSYLSISLS
jgi:ATP-binding cassette subfamily B (MDR/TAP) protein 6